MTNVAALNAMTPEAAHDALVRCCGSQRWAEGMLRRRPFASHDELIAAVNAVEKELDRADWLEAFAAHPRIGDRDSLRAKFATTAAWCSTEQAGVNEGGERVLQDLSDENQRYHERFGYIFIVCATGKSASEMLDLLRARLGNDPHTELQIAAAEQAKITRLRLEKL